MSISGIMGVYKIMEKVKLMKKQDLVNYVDSLLTKMNNSKDSRRIIVLHHSTKIRRLLVEVEEHLEFMELLTNPEDFNNIKKEYIIEDLEKIYLRFNKLKGSEMIDLKDIK
jgi:hypothetical protein